MIDENNTTVYTQKDIDNGILLVDMDKYNNEESFRIHIGKIFCSYSKKLTVWMVGYDSEGRLNDYTSLSYLATVQKMLDRGLVIATKEEYLRAKKECEELLVEETPVDPKQKEKFERLLEIWIKKEEEKIKL